MTMTDISPSQLQKQPPQPHRRQSSRSLRSKEIVARPIIPPSPELSEAEFPINGLPAGGMSGYLRQSNNNNNNAYYSHEQQAVAMDSIHPNSQPATRYSTPQPPPQRSMYQPSANHQQQQQMVQGYQHFSGSYPQPPQYEQSPYTFTDEYGTAVSTTFVFPFDPKQLDPIPMPLPRYHPGTLTAHQSSQPYSTPATSPPTPSRNPELVRVTRSSAYRGNGNGKATSHPPAQTSRSSTPKKKAAKASRPKAAKKSPHLSGPLSEITKDSAIPVVDIGAFVHRPIDDRIREVSVGKQPGKIKRPMNAFMLYRKAYQNRAKEWCSQHNHQVVSQVCGDSWPLEPEHVRAQFNDWAKLERDNHQKAHPSYKFTPSKPHKSKAKGNKRGRGDFEDDEDEYDDGDDLNDPDWHGSKRMRVTRTETPFDEYDQPPPRNLYQGGYHHNNRSAFHATNPGKPPPPQYDTHAAASGHYYQTMQVRDGQVEHVMYRKTPSPAMIHHQHPQQHVGYEYGGVYGAPPPQQMHHRSPPPHHQYLDASPQQYQQGYHPGGGGHGAQRGIDPSLLPPEQLLDIGPYNAQYPHQLDPAHSGGPAWTNEGGNQQVYLDHHQAQAFETYGVPVGAGGGGALDNVVAAFDPLMLQPEQQERLFAAEPWQVLDNPLAAEGDDWLKGLEELQQQQGGTPTVGQFDLSAVKGDLGDGK